MSGFERGQTAAGSARACAGCGPMFAARVRALGGALTGTDYDRLGYFFFRHAFALDFAFLAELLQAVFAGDSGYGSDQRQPAVLGFNFVEAQ